MGNFLTKVKKKVFHVSIILYCLFRIKCLNDTIDHSIISPSSQTSTPKYATTRLTTRQPNHQPLNPFPHNIFTNVSNQVIPDSQPLYSQQCDLPPSHQVQHDNHGPHGLPEFIPDSQPPNSQWCDLPPSYQVPHGNKGPHGLADSVHSMHGLANSSHALDLQANASTGSDQSSTPLGLRGKKYYLAIT